MKVPDELIMESRFEDCFIFHKRKPIVRFFFWDFTLMCIYFSGVRKPTEDKVQRSILEGFAQNIKQLESSYETNKKKRKREDDDFDYLYGIVTSARDWHFLLYSPGEISQASEIPYSIEFNKKALEKNSEEYHTLRKNVKKVLGVIV